MPVSEIVAMFPGARQVLTRHGVSPAWDELSLKEAAERARADLDQLLADLARAWRLINDHRSFPAEWFAASPQELVQLINDVYHTELRHLLPAFGLHLAQAILVCGEVHPELYDVGRLFEEFRALLSAHCRAEDVTFAALLESGIVDRHRVEELVRSTRQEHARLRGLLGEMRALTLEYPLRPYDCSQINALYDEWREIERVTNRAIFLEENRLVPLLEELMAQAGSSG